MEMQKCGTHTMHKRKMGNILQEVTQKLVFNFKKALMLILEKLAILQNIT